MSLDDFETVNLATELMVATETREKPAPAPEPTPEPVAVNSQDPETETPGAVKISEVIDPDEVAEYFVDGVDAIMAIAGGAFYAIKIAKILTKEEKKIYHAAKKKPEKERTDAELALIAYFDAEVARLKSKDEAVEMTEPERAKMIKRARGMVKVKNWKVGPDMAFWMTLTDIIGDRAIDAFMD